MRKKILFSAVLSLFLLVPASITWAQNYTSSVKTISGMVVGDYTTPEGRISVYLPNEIRPGDQVTGTVMAVPAGNTEKEKAKNLQALLQYSISAGGNKIALSNSVNTFAWLVPTDGPFASPMELLKADGKEVAGIRPDFIRLDYTVVPNVHDLKLTKKIMLMDDPLEILSPFGNLRADMKYLLEDATGKKFTIKPKTGTARQVIFDWPEGMSIGNAVLVARSTAQGAGDPVSTEQVSMNFTLVRFDFRAERSSLRKGESTTIWWQLKGLDTNRSKLPVVVIENLSPSNISMPAGNFQVATVERTNMDGRHEQSITAMISGAFDINAAVHLPGDAYCGVFNPQMRVIKTKEDFDGWNAALKKDLEAYAKKQGLDNTGQAINRNAQAVIDNIPSCSDDSKVAGCLSLLNYYLRNVPVPIAAATLWLSGFEAYKAAIKAISGNLSGKPELIDWDMISNGIKFVEVMGKEQEDQALQAKAMEAQLLLEEAKKAKATSDDLKELKDKLDELNLYARENKIGMDILQEHHYSASWLSQVSWNEFLGHPVNYYDIPKTGAENKADTIPCKTQLEELQKLEESLRALKDELAGIDDAISKAKKDTIGCAKAIAAKRSAVVAAADKLNTAKNRVKSLESGGKTAPQKETDALKAAGESKDKADADMKAKQKDCDDKAAMIQKLLNRKNLLPYKIAELEAAITAAEAGLEKCRQKEADDKKKKDDEAKRLEEEVRNAANTAAQKEENRRKSVETASYVLINIHELGLVSADDFWDMKGVWDVIPAIAAKFGIDLSGNTVDAILKALGDGAEDLGSVPGSTDIIQALGGIYQLIAAMKDPCQGLGKEKTVIRLMSRINKATGFIYTDAEAQDKTEMMCKMLQVIKKLSAMGAGK